VSEFNPNDEDDEDDEDGDFAGFDESDEELPEHTESSDDDVDAAVGDSDEEEGDGDFGNDGEDDDEMDIDEDDLDDDEDEEGDDDDLLGDHFDDDKELLKKFAKKGVSAKQLYHLKPPKATPKPVAAKPAAPAAGKGKEQKVNGSQTPQLKRDGKDQPDARQTKSAPSTPGAKRVKIDLNKNRSVGAALFSLLVRHSPHGSLQNSRVSS